VPLGVERVRRLANSDAGIVDEDIDPAEFACDSASYGGDGGLVSDVGCDRNKKPGRNSSR